MYIHIINTKYMDRIITYIYMYVYNYKYYDAYK